jgi:hypothetical protein
MTIYYYTFRTITEAMKASAKLQNRGFSVSPVRTPEPLRKKGCGYCIPIVEGRYHKVSGILQPREYEGLFRYRDGVWVEI